MRLLESLGRRLLFTLDPETAHRLSIAALNSGMPLGPAPVSSERLRTRILGLDLPNPLGIAAGFDKNAEAPDGLLRLGFGFAEVGTVTPLPQAGNPKPRIFRLPEDHAVINRLGFNNEGHDACARRLSARRGRPGVVGVNIGANKDSTDRVADYEAGVRRFSTLAGYLTINISSPNTPGLRAMQAREALAELLARVVAARNAAGMPVPLFLKIAPDLGETDLDDIAAEILDKRIDGVIVSNTTIARPPLESRAQAAETGGLSGRPLFARSTAVLAKMRRRLGPTHAIIGAGGVDSAEAALEKIRAGADLVQLYTGMVFAGPALPGRIVAGLARFAETEGLATLRDIRDCAVDRWADTPIG